MITAQEAQTRATAKLKQLDLEREMQRSKEAREKYEFFKKGQLDAWPYIGQIEALISHQSTNGLHHASFKEGPYEATGAKRAYLEGIGEVIKKELETHGFTCVVNIVDNRIAGVIMLDVGVGW